MDKQHNLGHSNNSQNTIFFQMVTNTINDFKMLEKRDKILVAVSGGADSICLVLSLLASKERYSIKLGIAHLNHMLRGEESLRDEAFVSKFADQLGLPFFSSQINVKAHAKKHGLSVEQAGREVRYEYFEHLSCDQGYTKIATGHNKDDNAELVLMNLLRGSGPKGLSGIPPIRNNIYIRPLIRIYKGQILDFLNSMNQEYMFDSSNNDMAYLRNRIRGKLLPHLVSEFNPEIIDALDRLSNILKTEEEYFEIETQKAYTYCLQKADDSSVALFKTKMSDLHPALLNRVLRKAIKTVKKNLNRITLAHINDIIQFSLNTISGSSLDLPGQTRVYKKNNIIIFKKEKKPLRDMGKKTKLDNLLQKQ
ncbi:MAG: tRNA lysidine(34) synthetase TilS [Desulfobacula sp.]|nr:tRNA lysidine(34) synthetase TilS [Desulfobacula sp.]